MTRKLKTKTFRREVVLRPAYGWKDPSVDFGLGAGVIEQAVMEYTDKRNQGFNSVAFMAACLNENKALLDEMFLVRRIPIAKRKKKVSAKR
jgi:hypothetical protein